MRHPLHPHPASNGGPITHIEVEVVRQGQERLKLRYGLTGAIEDIALPGPTAPKRADELWRHTCFEAFIKPAGGTSYDEFNFAPSTAWAAYHFTQPRQGMSARQLTTPPVITPIWSDQPPFLLQVDLDLSPLGDPLMDAKLGLAAIIETAQGELSYWALNHPPGPPDFHANHCFAAQLPAKEVS